MMATKVEITHPDRVVFPADGITKAEVVDYYTRIADVMVPHLRDRPLTLWRYPRGIDQRGFVQQDFADALPEWMGGVQVAKENGTVVHPTADRRDALRWLANQNCVTVHSWLARRRRLNVPDRVVFDLDPSSSDFGVVKETARAVAGVLDDLGLVSYVQTTGSRGLHVVTPLKGDADFDAVRQFARDVAEVVEADDPMHRTVEMRKAKRGDRVYLDVMRNGYAQTAVAPYAVRARPGAPVATPLEWDELGRRDLRPDLFTIRDVPKRVEERGDPWAELSRRGRSLTHPAQRLTKIRA
jgi:bifunctional non-homologous end joining protein LigD